MGGAVKKIGGVAKGIGGGINDTLFGKKVKGTKDRFMNLEGSQKKALGQYETALNANTNKMADAQITAQENQIRAGANDAQRNAQQLIAQRGLGRSSVGLNALINTQRDVGDKIGAARAMLPALQYDMKMNNLDRATNGIQNILGSRTFIQGTQGGRSGGLSGLIGAGVGGYLGGSKGAAVGMQAGNALGKTGMGL